MGKTNLVKVKEKKGRRRGRNKSASFRGEKKGSLARRRLRFGQKEE